MAASNRGNGGNHDPDHDHDNDNGHGNSDHDHDAPCYCRGTLIGGEPSRALRGVPCVPKPPKVVVGFSPGWPW